MDKLEDYIRKNREDLDRYTPSPEIWKKVKSGIAGKKLNAYQWFSIAAMVVVIISTAVFFLKTGTGWSEAKSKTGSDGSMVSADPQLKETEVYYINLVNSLYREASPLLTGNPELEKELNTDISQLDSICSDIRTDLKDNVANQEVVEALIQNYRIKIRLLEDMLVVLKENKNDPEKSKRYEL